MPLLKGGILYLCDSGVSMWIRVAVLSRGPVLIMFKINPELNLGNNYRICNNDNTVSD
jgi:hypothetical protein